MSIELNPEFDKYKLIKIKARGSKPVGKPSNPVGKPSKSANKPKKPVASKPKKPAASKPKKPSKSKKSVKKSGKKAQVAPVVPSEPGAKPDVDQFESKPTLADDSKRGNVPVSRAYMESDYHLPPPNTISPALSRAGVDAGQAVAGPSVQQVIQEAPTLFRVDRNPMPLAGFEHGTVGQGVVFL